MISPELEPPGWDWGFPSRASSDSDSRSQASPGSWAGPSEGQRVKLRERGCVERAFRRVREFCGAKRMSECSELSIEYLRLTSKNSLVEFVEHRDLL